MDNWQYIHRSRTQHQCQKCGSMIFEGTSYYKNGATVHCFACGKDKFHQVPQKVYREKNALVYLFLCIFLGYLGAHKFYVGKTVIGVLYLFTMGLFGFGWIIDIIKLMSALLSNSK